MKHTGYRLAPPGTSTARAVALAPHRLRDRPTPRGPPRARDAARGPESGQRERRSGVCPGCPFNPAAGCSPSRTRSRQGATAPAANGRSRCGTLPPRSVTATTPCRPPRTASRRQQTDAGASRQGDSPRRAPGRSRARESSASPLACHAGRRIRRITGKPLKYTLRERLWRVHLDPREHRVLVEVRALRTRVRNLTRRRNAEADGRGH